MKSFYKKQYARAPEEWSTKSHGKQMKKKDVFLVLTGFMMIIWLKKALSNSQNVE